MLRNIHHKTLVPVITEAQNGLVSNPSLGHRLKETELRLDACFERIDGKLKLNRWMLRMLYRVLSLWH
jgi:hypothetical protein